MEYDSPGIIVDFFWESGLSMSLEIEFGGENIKEFFLELFNGFNVGELFIFGMVTKIEFTDFLILGSVVEFGDDSGAEFFIAADG